MSTRLLCFKGYERTTSKRKNEIILFFRGIDRRCNRHQNVKTEDDWIEDVISIFKEDRRTHYRFLRKMVDLRVRHFLFEQYSIDDIHVDTLVKKLFSTQMMANIKQVEAEVGLEFPGPTISIVSISVQLLLLAIPAVLLVVFFVLKVEFLIVLHGLAKMGAVVFMGAIPYAIANLLFPTFFMPSEFYKIKTYDALIGYITLSNQLFFLENDYAMTKAELKAFLSSTD